jgi:hypothetical protein
MTTKTLRFPTHLLQTGKTTTGIEVPPDIIGQLGGGARPAVAVKVNGYSYRTTIGVMGGKSLLPFSAEHRAASSLKGGDPIEVELTLDTASRAIEIPAELEEAFAAEPELRAAFLKQAPSRQRADVENILGAKATETRLRRIEAIVARLRQ